MPSLDEYHSRRIVPAHGARWRFGGNPPTDLDTLVRGRIARLVDAGHHTGNRVLLGVAVERRDGMTRNAVRAQMTIAAQLDRRWRLRHLLGSRELRCGPVDELAGLVGGRRAVRRAARTSGLVPELRRDWTWWTGTGLVALVCTVAAGLMTHLASRSGAGAEVVVGLLSVAGVASLTARIATQHLTPLLAPGAASRLEEALAADPTDTDAERRFRTALREQLRAETRNRAIVIDDFGELHQRTRRLVEDHLRQPGERGEEEFWLIFEQGRRPGRKAQNASRQPSAPHLAQFDPDPSFEAWQCRQQPLTPAEKRRLVRRLDPRAETRTDRQVRHRAIADVIGRPPDEETVVGELQQQLQDADPLTARAFGLLALAATVPAPAPLAPQDLTAVLRRSPQQQSRVLERLLLDWFPAEARTPLAIQQGTKIAIRDFEGLFEEQAGRRSDKRVQEAALPFADALVAAYPWARETCGLPPADDGHAFWALYWHRVLTASGGWSAPAAERLLAHLCALREPEQFRRRHGPQAARALCEAGIVAVEASLALCVRGIVPDAAAGDGEARASGAGSASSSARTCCSPDSARPRIAGCSTSSCALRGPPTC